MQQSRYCTAIERNETAMIESIHIKNFRGIQDGKIDRFSKINLLVGPNNSGKSAVLETIYLASAASRNAGIESSGIRYDATALEHDLLGNDPLEVVCERHKKKVENTQDSGTVSRHFPHKSSTGFALHLQGTASKAGLFSTDIGSGFVKEINAEKEHKFLSLLGTSMFGEDFNKVEFLGKRLLYLWENGLTYYQAGEASWIIKGTSPSASQTFFFDVRNTLSHLPFEYFRKMIVTIPGWTQKIGRRFGQVFDLTKQFNVNFFQPQEALHLTQGYISPEDKIALTIDDYGDGARSAFKLLTPLIALAELATEDEPGVFIWEEPELFQNPRTLGKLLEEIALLIKDKPVQLFIATHSLDVIAQFTALAENGQIETKDLMTFRLNLQAGQLTSSWFNVDNLKAWLEEGLDPRVWGEFKSPLQFRFQEEGE